MTAGDHSDMILLYPTEIESTAIRSPPQLRTFLLPVQPGYLAPQIPDKPPQQGEAWADIMADIDTKIMPGTRQLVI